MKKESMSKDPITGPLENVDISLDAFDQLRDQALTYMAKEEVAQLVKAYNFAKNAHEGQIRKTGESFINHPVQVALILAELRMDVDTVTAAILHDTVEDSSTTLEEVETEFSPSVRELVDGVTKITRLEIETLSESQVNNLRKMLIAMARDIRVIVIKLADRLHNMRTLMALKEDRRIFKARETMEIYAPLAHRLGINSIKWELEDLAFYYLEPARFQQVSRMVAESRSAREEYLDRTIVELSRELDKLGISAKITGRPKHLYSIYQKMAQKGKDFSEIYDLIALRLIVDSIKDCYSSLGAVHTIWRPMPGRFKDYIAMPKFNMYQSLHTTVIGPAGRPLEIQIRTKEMHHTSEYGVAAHWRYKDGRDRSSFDIYDEQLAWLRQMLDWADEAADPKEFMESLKVDLTDSEVFVFTPKGEVINLRSGSTPIDFAYAIHTEVGNHCVGAKVNGSIVPLSYELQMGDRVEILTQKSSGPSRDWLNMVRTPSARSKIRNYFSKMSREGDLLHGREQLGREMRKNGLGLSSARSLQAVKKVSEDMGYLSPDDTYVMIGSGKLSAKQVANKMLRILLKTNESEQAGVAERPMTLDSMTEMMLEPVKPRHTQKPKSSTGVVIKGMDDDVLVRLSRCCNPVPGDDIVGFVTRGRGVSVHRSNCPNARALLESPERIIEVEWASKGAATGAYNVEVFVEAIDRLKLFQDVTVSLSGGGVNILGANLATHKDGIVEMRFLFEVSEIAHVEKILRDLRAVEGVIDARRMLPGEVVRKRKDL